MGKQYMKSNRDEKEEERKEMEEAMKEWLQGRENKESEIE